MSRVTGLRKAGAAVAVELDGEPWRRLPAEVVLGCGLRTGVELNRRRLRRIRSGLRRVEALEIAARLLRHRDLSAARLVKGLARRGIAPAVRTEAVRSLTRAGLVDDVRAAAARARALAERSRGDAAISWRLEQEGFTEEAVVEALAALDPERERAQAVVDREGLSPRTLRRLSTSGFSAETLEGLMSVAGERPPAVGYVRFI